MKRTMKPGLMAAGLAALLLMASAPSAAAPAGADSKETKQESVSAVDINSATVEELMSVPGIGQVIAQRIVEFREKNGPYKTVDELLKVQGIGEKSLAKYRERLSIGLAKK